MNGQPSPSPFFSFSFRCFPCCPHQVLLFILFYFFFWLGLSYVKCIKTIAQAEEPQSVFIYEAQLEETEKELKPQQGFGYGLRPSLWLGSYSGLSLGFFGFGRERCVVLLSNCSSTTPTKNNKTKKNTVAKVFYASH